MTLAPVPAQGGSASLTLIGVVEGADTIEARIATESVTLTRTGAIQQ